MNKPYFEYNPETHMTFCSIERNGKVFIGEAFCHKDDWDMESEKTGCQIAECRANIKMLIHIRDNEIKSALRALYQYYYTINKSKKFNEKSYEFKMLKRQIKRLENDLSIIRKELAEEKEFLKTYITGKNKFYKTLRDKRALAKTD